MDKPGSHWTHLWRWGNEYGWLWPKFGTCLPIYSGNSVNKYALLPTLNYCIRVHNYTPVKNRITSFFWCCQDIAHKKRAKLSTKEGVQNHETLSLQHFKCRSKLLITCTSEDIQILHVNLSHSQSHTPYFDVSVPPGAIDIICNNINWALPNDVVGKVQLLYLQVTAKQITTVWTKFAQNSWKQNPKDQMDSAQQLLQEFSEDVDMFEVDKEKGIDQLV